MQTVKSLHPKARKLVLLLGKAELLSFLIGWLSIRDRSQNHYIDGRTSAKRTME